MLGIVWHQCRTLPGIDKTAFKTMASGFKVSAAYSVCFREDMNHVFAALDNLGVQYVPFKGCVISDYYPVPVLRTMGDIDILIHPEDMETVSAMMLASGYEEARHNGVFSYNKSIVMYEFHSRLCYEESIVGSTVAKFFDRAWDYCEPSGKGCRCDFTPSFHLLYLFAHLSKHFVAGGCGFRLFADVAVCMTANRDSLDFDFINSSLETIGFSKFAESVCTFCSRWFDLELPLAGYIENEDFYISETDKLFGNGVFGAESCNERNTAVASNAFRRSKLPYFLTALLITLRQLFPSYTDMRYVPWYSFIDGRPWLMPFAWIYRYYYVIRYKFSEGKTQLTKPFAEREEIEKRGKAVSSWGL